MPIKDKYEKSILKSNLVSRDLSWLQFNYRVLDQAKSRDRNVFERMKFLAITASNADEFFMIRVGSLYNYLDYNKDRVDYSGLRSRAFKRKLFEEIRKFHNQQTTCFNQDIVPYLKKKGVRIVKFKNLFKREKELVQNYFEKTVFPMLTPMTYDSYHSFPVLMNKVIIVGVVSAEDDIKKMSFVQIPMNLPRFFEIDRNGEMLMLPLEEIVRSFISELFRNVHISSVTVFRITRNGDFTLEESEDIETNFLEELKQKLKERKTGRVVRLEIERENDPWLIEQLRERWNIDNDNIFEIYKSGILDFSCLWQIINNDEFSEYQTMHHKPVKPLSLESRKDDENIFNVLRKRDVLLHHPYNSIEPLLELIEKAAEDPKVLSIKLTIYRLAKNSRIVSALLRALENGKNVAALFEVKARFDEENNIRQANRLREAGCYVVYGVGNLKTHTKLLLIVRKEGEKDIKRYVHMSSGNYNESTSKLYTDIGFISSDEGYANDVSEFFNVITGHSQPEGYNNLITAPRDMRDTLISLIKQEAKNAKAGIRSGIVIKMNSLQDKETIESFYKASQAGVKIELIVRGICCLRPGRKGLSDNIRVRSIVGDFLEHSRICYFHNNGKPKVYSGSADMMVRSFDRRLESLFIVKDELLKQQVINILDFNLKDTENTYLMNEDGTYEKIKTKKGDSPFNIHKEFYHLTKKQVMNAKLF